MGLKQNTMGFKQNTIGFKQNTIGFKQNTMGFKIFFLLVKNTYWGLSRDFSWRSRLF